MITDVYVIINNESQKEQIAKANLNISPFFYFIDERIEKSKALKLKGSFAAKKTPFAIVYDKNKPIKAFYSEHEKDVIISLINYLNE